MKYFHIQKKKGRSKGTLIDYSKVIINNLKAACERDEIECPAAQLYSPPRSHVTTVWFPTGDDDIELRFRRALVESKWSPVFTESDKPQPHLHKPM